METQTTLSARSLQYYAVTRKWASDIEFFQFETAFLENLLNDLNNKAGKVFSEEYKIAQINSLKLLKDHVRAAKLINEQLTELGLMAEDIISEDTERLKGNQITLEYLMADITKEYREVKKRIFRLVEKVVNAMD